MLENGIKVIDQDKEYSNPKMVIFYIKENGKQINNV